MILYLNPSDSKAISERMAAASPAVVMPYFEKASVRKGAAASAVSHSSRKVAPAQEFDCGAIPIKMALLTLILLEDAGDEGVGA